MVNPVHAVCDCKTAISPNFQIPAQRRISGSANSLFSEGRLVALFKSHKHVTQTPEHAEGMTKMQGGGGVEGLAGL